jgi:transposase
MAGSVPSTGSSSASGQPHPSSRSCASGSRSCERTSCRSPRSVGRRGYFDRHADALGRYLENGRLEIDNNRCERAIRKVAVGSKNWLFAGSPAGGQSTATLYSLTVGCWELGLDPFDYLTDVLTRLGSTPNSRIVELTPRAWEAARQG